MLYFKLWSSPEEIITKDQNMAKKKILAHLPFYTYTVRTKEGANKKEIYTINIHHTFEKGGGE